MARTITTGGKPRVVAAVRPNAGLAAGYARRLAKLVEDMQASLVYFLKAAYRANPPVLAQDSPAQDMQRAMRILRVRWEDRFDKAAKQLGRYYGQAMAKRSDAQLRQILRRAGIAVEFKMTPAMTDVMHATIGEQVGLIKSIAEQHLGQVEGIVLRGVQTGGDLQQITKQLHARYAITRKRAAFIAHDQNSKAIASMTRVRQEELGMQEAIWLHSHAGKEPRPTHLANSGKKYKIAEGWFDPDPKVQEHIWPGQLINCRCVSKPIVPGFT